MIRKKGLILQNGLPSPTLIDDLTKVNQRRKSVGLNTLEEQIAIMRRRAINENSAPPADFESR